MTQTETRRMGVLTVSRAEGVTNRAYDATVWATWTFNVGEVVELKLEAVWDVTVRLQVGRRRWFASDRVNRGLWRVTAWLFDWIEGRYERQRRQYDDDDMPVRWAM